MGLSRTFACSGSPVMARGFDNAGPGRRDAKMPPPSPVELVECWVLDSHVPPGNPDNFHTILVGESAVRAHLAHTDLLGDCGDLCEQLCDDGNPCTIDACDATGSCLDPPDREPTDCDDFESCTEDSCSPETGCVNDPLPGDPCDDSMICTADDLCTDQGLCEGIVVAGCCVDDAQCDPDPCLREICNLNTNLCEADPVVCVPPDFCHISACAEGQCVDEPIVCEEGCDPASGCIVCEGFRACDGTCLGFPPNLPDSILCDGTCVNRLSDPANCGDCEQACAADELCADGVCEPGTGGCPPGLTQCGAACADLESDEQHCGQCDNTCPEAWSCIGGVCLDQGRG